MLLVAFLAGVVVGLLLAEFYPRRDREFREYLRREYGTKPAKAEEADHR
jgi:hypothetical protein